jgi:hypothetical protein
VTKFSLQVSPTSMALEISFCFRERNDDTFVNSRPACCDVDSRNGVRSDGLSEAAVFLDWVGGGYPCLPLSAPPFTICISNRVVPRCAIG